MITRKDIRTTITTNLAIQERLSHLSHQLRQLGATPADTSMSDVIELVVMHPEAMRHAAERLGLPVPESQ